MTPELKKLAKFLSHLSTESFEGWTEDQIAGYNTCLQTIQEKINTITPGHHEHDCDHCVYLGSDEEYDFYVHPSDNQPTIIARYGEAGDYKSGLDFIMTSPILNKAFKLAYEQGHIKGVLLENSIRAHESWFKYEIHKSSAAGINRLFEDAGVQCFWLVDWNKH